MADIAIVWDKGCGSLQLNGADLLTDDSGSDFTVH
ncbi:hypothetical protein BvCmsNSP003_02082 [Escherichia coli]|nr:hypothetical protein BvCmsNSP003_02082 [Escherichia coli]